MYVRVCIYVHMYMYIIVWGDLCVCVCIYMCVCLCIRVCFHFLSIVSCWWGVSYVELFKHGSDRRGVLACH